jgi:pimeloyl-ACP methyl ester carboxylesterase
MRTRFSTQLLPTLTNRQLLRRVAAILVLAGLVLFILPARAAAAQGGDQQPTIVLVHGAWAGPSSWDNVVRLLNDDGYRTVTPTLGLTSLAADVATVTNVLDGIPGKKILVGHSYGGAVISDASAGRSDVAGLVFSAAFVPDQGDSLLSLGTGFAQSGVTSHLLWDPPTAPFAPGSLASIDPAFFQQFFAQDLSTKQAATLAANQRPIAFIPVFVTPSGPVGWHQIPCWYQVSGADRMIDPAQEQFMGHRACQTVVTYPTASHVGGITLHAEQFTGLIEQAADSTQNQQ